MPPTFNEILGREVAIPEHPQRIVSLSPALTESLFQLGLGDRVVAVSAFCARPESARQKKKVGSYSSTNLDVLRELEADLIVTITGYQRDLGMTLSKEFPVYPLALPVSVTGIIDTVVKLGLVVGEAQIAWEISSQLTRKLGQIPQSDRSLRAYLEVDLGGPVSFGANSYITDAFHFLGVSTTFDSVRSEWLTPDLQRVPQDDPDLFFYEAKMYSRFSQQDLERLIDKRGWRGMRAVRTGSYFLSPGPLDFFAHHGPSFITEAMPWLAERIARGTARGPSNQ